MPPEKPADELVPAVYDQLRDIAADLLRKESPDHTLQATALVNEAYLKLQGQHAAEWQNRTHFVAISAQAMRRILVDHARTKSRQKRGGGKNKRLLLAEDLVLSQARHLDVIALDEALEKLHDLDQRMARVVELRFFGGMTMEEVAQTLECPLGRIENDWRLAKAWLRREIAGTSQQEDDA